MAKTLTMIYVICVRQRFFKCALMNAYASEIIQLETMTCRLNKLNTQKQKILFFVTRLVLNDRIHRTTFIPP